MKTSMRNMVCIHSNRDLLVQCEAESFMHAVEQTVVTGRLFYVALAGGQTPRQLYEYLARASEDRKIAWEKVHFFWGDERCVSPYHSESNFCMANDSLIQYISIPRENIHRILGENDPDDEARRYADELAAVLPISGSGWPIFDWIWLGLGTDGHTASLFSEADLDSCTLDSPYCLVTEATSSIKKRISISMPVINAAKRVVFVVSGPEKANIADKILNQRGSFRSHPAAWVLPVQGQLLWHLDCLADDFFEKQLA